MSTDVLDRQFRCLPPGMGGTFEYSNEVRPIGIQKCETSLGVTFRIDSVRVFCANLQFNGSGECKALSKEKGEILRRQVFENLKNLSKNETWEMNNGKFGRDALAVCQKIACEDGKDQTVRYPAWFMLQGLNDFFMDSATELKNVMEKLHKCYPEVADEICVPAEIRTRFHDVWWEIGRDIQVLFELFSNVKLAGNIAGFVVDGNYSPNNLFYLDTNGRAAHVAGYDTGERARHKYVAKKLTDGNAALPKHGTKGSGPKEERWSF